MPRPVTRTYVSFATGYTGTPVWTEITQRVMVDPGIDIEHWRDEEHSETQPSKCALVLQNNDGRFTPENTASPYSPNIKRNRPIKVESTHNGVTYTRFRGWVDDWVTEWPAVVGSVNFCTVTASSRTARLAKGNELRSIIEEEYLLDDPFAYWPLGEPAASSTAYNIISASDVRPNLIVNGSGAAVTFGTATGPGTDDLTAVSFGGGKYLENDSVLPAGVIGLELFQLRSATPGSNRIIAAASDGLNWVALVIDNTGGVGLVGNGAQSFTSTAKITDGTYHHLYWDIPGADIWIDGVADGGSTGTHAITNPTTVTIGGWRGNQDHGSSEPHMDGTNGTAHVAIHTVAPSTPRKLDHYTAGHDGFDGETAADRIERYAGYVGIAPADLDLVGTTPIGHFDITGTTALDAMRRVELTEGGVLYDALDGKLALRGRDARYGLTAAFTVDYDAGEIDSAGIRPVLDDQQQVNDMTATNLSGVSARSFDQTAIDDDGYYRDSADLATTADTEPYERATWVVSRYKSAIARISDLPILLDKADNTLVAGVLNASVGTKFSAISLPANAPRATMDLFVEGRHDVITGNDDRVVLHTSPAQLYDVFILDTGNLGTDALAY